MAGNESFTYSPDDLSLGTYPVHTEKVTILSGQDLTRGAVIGRVTASGKWVLSATAAGDGSEVARAIALVDIDATGGDVDIVVAKSGVFNESKLNFGTGHDADTVRVDLEGTPLFLALPV